MNFVLYRKRNLQSFIIPCVLIILLFLFVGTQSARAETVEITVTGEWSARNFKVINLSDKLYKNDDPRVDGKVFGVAPSDGTTTLRVIVNTDGALYFPKGSQFATDKGSYILSHDFYGYTQVSLPADGFYFGNATWKSGGILRELEGPGNEKAALWTDADIKTSTPQLISFRIFGNAPGLNADLFVGSRTSTSIGKSFLLWEYYRGEEIRSSKYTVKTRILKVMH